MNTSPLNAPLNAISPIDGRYADKAAELRPIFSERGLIRQRVRVEALWLKALAAEPGIDELRGLPVAALTVLDALAAELTDAEAVEVKRLERETNHDVKAVEYFVKSRLESVPAWRTRREFVHFACTSEDINNLSYALMLREARDQVLLPRMDALIARLRTLAHTHAATPMMSRTHGQPATPTTLGKEIANFTYRLREQRTRLAAVTISGKINGAVGNFNAHLVAYPQRRLAETRSALRRIAGPALESIHHADRAARLDGGIFRCGGALEHRAGGAMPRHVGLHLDRLFPAARGGG